MKTFFKISQQTFWQLLGRFTTSLSTFIVLGIIARSFSTEGTGVFTLTLAYLTFFYIGADLGLNAYILPKFKDSSSQANKLLSFRLFWSLLLILLANIIALLLPFHSLAFSQAVLFGSSTILLSAVFNTVNLVFQNFLVYQYSSLASFFGSIAYLISVLALSLLQVPVQYLLLGLLISGIISTLVASILAQKRFHFKVFLPEWSFISGLFKDCWPISLTMLVNTLYFRADAFILAKNFPLSEVGLYNIAYQYFQLVLILPTYITNSFYPLMLEELKNTLKVPTQLKTALLTLLGLSVTATVFIFLTAPFLITILAGDKFMPSVPALKTLSLSFPAFFLTALLMLVMIAKNLYRKLLLVYLIGLLANISLNLLLIPQFSYFAASWVTVFSEYLILLLQLIILGKTIFK